MSRFDPESEKPIWAARRSGGELIRPGSQFRDAHVRDRARVIHSAAFRRLQAKTQVLGIGEGDFHRTRLTHSMEAAQISRGIVRAIQANKGSGKAWLAWLPNPNLIETIALAHDIGHPPFGHGGEIALNFAMRDAGGFEGNGQTLRLIARLEAHTEGFGLDLTRRTLLGVLKYPVPYESVVRLKQPPAPAAAHQLKRNDWKPPKCYLASEEAVVSWILEPFPQSDRDRVRTLARNPTNDAPGKPMHHAFDTGIMELGDDIAYGVHDFEDAIALRLVHREDWRDVVETVDQSWAASIGLGDVKSIENDLFGSSSHSRKRTIGALVNAMIVSVDVYEDSGFEHPLLRYQAALDGPAREFLDGLRDLVGRKVIKTPQVQTLEYRGQQLILRVFEALASDPQRLLKDNFADEHGRAVDGAAGLRVICDYLSGMTDEYATRMYERLFVPRHGQFSDRF